MFIMFLVRGSQTFLKLAHIPSSIVHEDQLIVEEVLLFLCLIWHSRQLRVNMGLLKST